MDIQEKARARDPELEAEVQAALAHYRDRLEWELVDLGRRRDNVLAYFGALKRELPHLYIDRIVTANVDVSAVVEGPELRRILGELAGVASPESRAALVGHTATLQVMHEGSENPG